MKPQLPTRPTRDPDRISATWLQRLLDCVAWAMDHPKADGRTLLGAEGILSVIGQGSGAPRHDRWLARVHNTTSITYDTFSPVFLGRLTDPPTGSAWTPETANQVEFELAAPDPDAPIAILTGRLAPGQHGLAVVSGLAVATVNILRADHRYARYNGSRYYDSGTWRYLASDTFGHRILSSPGATGFQACVLCLGSSAGEAGSVMFASLTSLHPASPASGDIAMVGDIFRAPTGGTAIATGATIMLYSVAAGTLQTSDFSGAPRMAVVSLGTVTWTTVSGSTITEDAYAVLNTLHALV